MSDGSIGVEVGSFERMGRFRRATTDARDIAQMKECTMGKTGRKRRARKKKGANHGKRPNA